MATYFHLVIRATYEARTQAARVYPLPRGRTLIGTLPTCDIRLDDYTISEQHAQIDYDADNDLYRLTDLNSTHGTRLRGGRLPPDTPIPLRPNAIFQIGSYELVFEEHDAWSTPGTTSGEDEAAETYLRFDPYEGEVPPGLARYSLRLLHYLPEIYRPSAPFTPTERIYLFRLADEFVAELTAASMSERLCQQFVDHGTALVPAAHVKTQRAGREWSITQGERKYIIAQENQGLHVYEEVADNSPTTFLARFLALFESVLLPLESVITNFDFYLDARTAPVEFLPWLEYWYGLPLAVNLSEEQRRQALLGAYQIFELKGTAAALKQVLTLCTGIEPTIDDQSLPGARFTVKFPAGSSPVDRVLVEHLINAFKPVHTTYELQIG